MIRTVLFRLMVSYTALVFALAIWTSFASYYFFQQKYNAELERIHLLKVRRIADEIVAKVVDNGKRIYLDTATELLRGSSGTLFGEDDEVAGNHAKLFLTYQRLGSLVAQYGDSVESVSLYYRNADLYLSFPFGVRFGNDPSNDPYFEPFRRFLERRMKLAWANRPGESPSLYRSFPILAEGDAGTVVVSVGFLPSALRELISAGIEDAGERRYLLDADGSPIVSSADEAWSPALEKAFGAGAGRFLPAAEPVRVVELEGTRQLLASLPVGDSGWRLVSATPARVLYSKGDSIRATLLLICAAAIVLGVAVSTILSARIYNPLDRLLVRLRRLFGSDIPASAAADEYGIIGDTIEGLSSRMDELSAALERSRPLIKQEVAAALLTGDFGRWGEPEETIAALRIGPFPDRMIACLVKIRPLREELGDIDQRLLRHRVAEFLESSAGGFALSCVLSSGELALVLPSESGGPSFAELIAEIRGRFEAELWVCFGDAVSGPRLLGASFETARRVSAYAYFYPHRQLFTAADGFIERETKSARLDQAVFDTLAEGLRRHDGALASSALADAVEFSRSDRASADACRRELARFARSLAEIQAELFPSGAATFRERAEAAVSSSADVQEFKDALNAAIALFNELSAPSPDARMAASVAEVKRLIESDLQGDLSLSRLGGTVGLSPGYLGKVFAAATGTHLVDYVTERRLAEASRLLRESGAEVQEVGRRVGFNSPAYFIRRFKERFGRTPYDYRRMSAGDGRTE